MALPLAGIRRALRAMAEESRPCRYTTPQLEAALEAIDDFITSNQATVLQNMRTASGFQWTGGEARKIAKFYFREKFGSEQEAGA